jgi:hypothetical protein
MKKTICISVCYSFLVLFILPSCATRREVTALPLAQSRTVEADELKALILRPAGWEAIAKYPGAVTFIDIVFKEDGEQVKVKLGGWRRDCERDVIFISSDTLQFDGCVDREITLKRDINDDVWKLKGTSKMGADLKLKEVDAK